LGRGGSGEKRTDQRGDFAIGVKPGKEEPPNYRAVRKTDKNGSGVGGVLGQRRKHKKREKRNMQDAKKWLTRGRFYALGGTWQFRRRVKKEIRKKKTQLSGSRKVGGGVYNHHQTKKVGEEI